MILKGVQIESLNEMLKKHLEKDTVTEKILTTFRIVKQTVVRHTKVVLTNLHLIARKQSRHRRNTRVTRRAVGMGKGPEEEERPNMQIRSSLY